MVSKLDVLSAMRRYDAEYPNNDYRGGRRKSWLDDRTYSRAIKNGDRLYPPKAI